MKLLGVTNGEYVLASMGHYDYNSAEGMMADGGQPGTLNYAGYTRFSGKTVWFEVPQTFAELYYDYNCRDREDRLYGLWKVEDVRILAEDEYPDTDSLEYKVENAVWGTRGPKGDQPLKYVHLLDCDVEYLEKIQDYRGGYNENDEYDDLGRILKYLIELER